MKMPSRHCSHYYIVYFIVILRMKLAICYNGEMKLVQQCFNLPVFYDCLDSSEDGSCLQSEYLYDLELRDDHTTIQLSCSEASQSVHVIYAEYSMPSSKTDFCLDVNTTCTKTQPCSCCTEPYTSTNICYKQAKIDQALLNRCERTTNCDLNFKKQLIDKSDCPNLDYRCNIGDMDNSWCYSRWISVYYECRDTVPTLTPPGPSSRRPTSTTTTSTTTTTTTTTTVKPAIPTIYIEPIYIYTTKNNTINKPLKQRIRSHAKKSATYVSRTTQPPISSHIRPVVAEEKVISELKTSQNTENESAGWMIGAVIICLVVGVCAAGGCIIIIVLFVRETKSKAKPIATKESKMGSSASTINKEYEAEYHQITMV